MADLCEEVLIVSIFSVHIDGDFDGYFDGDFDGDLDFVGPVDVDGLVDINNFLDDGGHLYCLYYFSWGFIGGWHRHFLFHLDVFGHLHNFLDDPFGAWDVLEDFHDDLDWLLDDDLFDDFSGVAGVELLHFLIFVLDRPSQ